jgi:uncharacterized protein (AIM24 family)
VVEYPVPLRKLGTIVLIGSRQLIVDGEMMLMDLATLEVELKPLARDFCSLYRSREGLVYTIRGRGAVWLTPTLRMR